MYTYSPVKSIYIKNFRNLGEVKLDFDESPIITLVGENESGKTSIVKAFATCAMHANPREQKAFIRDGTQGFGVAIELEDGTLITRIKTASNNRYTVKKPDGTGWDANKLENEVPKAVQEVMGMIEEPETKEFLHIRTYEDQLLFVVTPASTNYKVMYDALKISQLTRAIKYGSTEANALKQKISSGETSVGALQASLRNLKTYDIEPLLNIKHKLERDRHLLSKINRIVELKDSVESMSSQLGSLSLIEKNGLGIIDEIRADRIFAIDRLLNSISDLNKSLSVYSIADTVDFIDTTLLDKMDAAISRQQEIKDMQRKSQSYIDLANVNEISEVNFSKLENAFNLKTSLDKSKQMLLVYDLSGANPIEEMQLQTINKLDKAIEMRDYATSAQTSLEQINDYVEKVIDWMKQVGVATTSCPRCGEDVIIDLDMLKEDQ